MASAQLITLTFVKCLVWDVSTAADIPFILCAFPRQGDSGATGAAVQLRAQGRCHANCSVMISCSCSGNYFCTSSQRQCPGLLSLSFPSVAFLTGAIQRQPFFSSFFYLSCPLLLTYYFELKRVSQ